MRAGEGLVTPGEAGAALFERALAVGGPERRPFDIARVRLFHGERLRRLRETARARQELSAALEAFEHLGAAPWGSRAAAELRAAGQAAPSAARPERASLTARERQIATPAAGGTSNEQIAERLFLSHRTVGTRLYRIHPELGITTRAALRDALAAFEADDDV